MGVMTTGWSHGSGKGSGRWWARPGSAGLKGGIPPSELEGISRPRTVTSHQGRSGQQPLAWSCPLSACLGEAPGETAKWGDASEASRCVIRRQGGLEPALGGGQ